MAGQGDRREQTCLGGCTAFVAVLPSPAALVAHAAASRESCRGRRAALLLGDTDLAEIDFERAKVVGLGDVRDPLLRDDPVVVVGEMHVAAGLAVLLSGLDVGVLVAG